MSQLFILLIKERAFSYNQVRLVFRYQIISGGKKWIKCLNVSLHLQWNSQIKSQTLYINKRSKADGIFLPIFQSIFGEMKEKISKTMIPYKGNSYFIFLQFRDKGGRVIENGGSLICLILYTQHFCTLILEWKCHFICWIPLKMWNWGLGVLYILANVYIS